MTRQSIVETTLAGMRPTGVAGRRVIECWDQIDNYLRANLGQDAADLFAEPVEQGNGVVVWFGPGGTPPRPYAALPDDEQAAARDRLRDLKDRLEAEASRLLSEPQPPLRTMGEMLVRAQRLPGTVEDALFVIDGRLVLINWSMDPEGEPPAVQPLQEFVRRPVPPPLALPPAPFPSAPALPSPPAPSGTVAALPPPLVEPAPGTVVQAAPLPWWWLLWVLFAAALAGAFHLLLIGCGVWGTGLIANHCPAPPPRVAVALGAEDDREALLRAEIAQLEQQLRQRPRCEAPRSAEPPPQSRPPEQRAEFERRIEQSGAQEGELTITLIWNTPSDLDLYVRCPSGKVINFSNRDVCGGHLDVDANVGIPAANPVENVYFPAGSVTPGTYTILVRTHTSRGSAPNKFTLRIKRNGAETFHEGTAPSEPGNVFVPDLVIQ